MYLRRFLFTLFAGLIATASFGPASFAQSTAKMFTLNAANQCASVSVSTYASVGIQVTGTFSATLQPEVSIGGQSPQNSQVTPTTSNLAQATITTTGTYAAAVGGMDTFLLCVSSYVSGSAVVWLNPSDKVNASTLGGGAVASVFGRTGVVTAQTGDYTCAQVTNCLGSGIVTTGLLASYPINEGTGTTLTDTSGNGNNGTFCVSAPTWSVANSANAGLLFDGASNCVNLPAALNTARTFQLVETFSPTNVSQLMAPICGNGSNNWGAMFRGYQPALTQNVGLNGGEFFLSGFAKNGNPYQVFTTQPAGGTAIVTWELGATADSTNDEVWMNNNLYPFNAIQPNGSPGTTKSYDLAPFNGVYVLGGSAAGVCTGPLSSWWPGTMYELLVYSTYLTQAQVTQNYAAIAATNNARGIATLPQNLGTLLPNRNNNFVALGDSITAGTATTTVYPQFITFPTNGATWNWIDLGIPSNTALNTAAGEGINMRIAAAVYPGAGNNYEPYWEGTNDCEGGGTGPTVFANVVSALRAYRKHLIDVSRSQPLAVVTMISRTGDDVCKNALNALLRQNWQTFADDFIDIAADPNLGADGAYASTTYFVDAVHPTSQAQANNVAPIFQRAVGRYFGHQNWTTATTYTTAAAAAVATTAGSQSSTTVTVTMSATPANCQVGNTAIIAGVTPSAYNNFWQILTRSSTQITFYALAAGLGTITGQGTVVCPQQQDADVYTILGGSAVTPNFTLESCMGYTGQNIYLKNANTTSPWTVTPFQSSETIDGASSLTMPVSSSGNNSVVILQAQLISAAAAGCTWKRMQ